MEPALWCNRGSLAQNCTEVSYTKKSPTGNNTVTTKHLSVQQRIKKQSEIGEERNGLAHLCALSPPQLKSMYCEHQVPGTTLGTGATPITEQQRVLFCSHKLTFKQGEADHSYRQVEKNNNGERKREKDALLDRTARAECSNKWHFSRHFWSETRSHRKSAAGRTSKTKCPEAAKPPRKPWGEGTYWLLRVKCG